MLIEVDQLTQVVHGGRRVLHDVTLAVRPGELVAIIGASGAGKTTLLEALAGLRAPAAGTVLHDGVPQDGAGYAGTVGYVPQDDIIHLQLPLVRTLRYAARMRLPAGTEAAALRNRVDEVLASLRLTDRAGVPVGYLSGGERKRASIAVELLARPSALFLDEPTSGLDPATAADLLRMLRRLSDDGIPTLLTTHNPADVDICDRVVVLARDGQLAFAGSPAAAREHFGVDTVAQIYERLDDEGDQPPWHPEAPRRDDGVAPRPLTPPRTIGPVRQGALLTVRSLDILWRNRLTLAILVGAPLAILAMFLMLFHSGAFDPARPSPATTVMILFWIAFGVFFFGLTYGLLQICTELPILRREVFTGLRVVPYIGSKMAVLLPLLALVDLLLLVVLRVLRRLPALSAGDFASVYLTALLTSVCALALGLLCSAAVSDVTQVGLVLPMLCFPQVLFVGAILPVPAMAAVGRWLSYAMSNRWSFEALGHSTGVVALWRDGGSPLGPPLLATYGDTFSRPVAVDWLILAGFTVLFLIGTWVVLDRKCRVRR
ncbi:MAG TPA: ATP-binding cassette domain-containing protein [Micromonosporaceae bacterium]|nr:ATP-binding cassette domain-containing protein [Micromonosporaceae bacterium]